MGNRANFVWVENQEVKIYYSHWRAVQTPAILLKGIEFCKQYFKEFHEDGWLMDVAFAEGGLLIDTDQKKILLFSGDDMFGCTPALRRLYCTYATKQLEGWDLMWCSQGNVDIAEYLGLMENRILTDSTEPEFSKYPDEPSEWHDPSDKGRPQENVITIISNSIIKDYKTNFGIDGIHLFIAEGEPLKDIIPEELRIETWQSEEETCDCFLADYDTKKLYVCWANNTDFRHEAELRRIWKGWKIYRQNEGLIFHFDYTNRDKSVVELTEERFLLICDRYQLLAFKDTY